MLYWLQKLSVFDVIERVQTLRAGSFSGHTLLRPGACVSGYSAGCAESSGARLLTHQHFVSSKELISLQPADYIVSLTLTSIVRIMSRRVNICEGFTRS
jgi:hypothetical protein